MVANTENITSLGTTECENGDRSRIGWKWKFIIALATFASVTWIFVLLTAPKISFAEPEFTYLSSSGSTWGNFPEYVSCKVQVLNDGLMPVWYVEGPNGNHALTMGFLIEKADSRVIELREGQLWKRLGPGETVLLWDTYNLEVYPDNLHGIIVRDCLGKQHSFELDRATLKANWDVRESLPSERE